MNDNLIDGLEEAKELLKDKVPVIYAWEAIKAVERAIEYVRGGAECINGASNT